MITNNNRWKTALASVAVLVLWTLICFNTDRFSQDGKFLTGEYILCYALTLGMWAICSLKFNFTKTFNLVLSAFALAIVPFACMQISMSFYPELEYGFATYMLNVLIYMALMGVFFAIVQSTAWAGVIVIVVAYIFNFSAYLVELFRGTPLIPSDLLAINTAIGVAKEYSFTPDHKFIKATVLAVFFITLVFKFPIKLNFRHKKLIYPASGLLLALAILVPMGLYDVSALDVDLFDQQKTNKMYGTTYNFYVNMRKMSLDKPKDYNKEEIKKILDSVPKSHPKDTPNIIVIMNESFADLKTVGDFATTAEYMPFFDKMEKNAIKGQAIVSPYGGYTCNSEFEFLTGISMGLLPQGSAPYLQYITRPMPNVLSAYLKEMGYTTIVWHPYYKRGWNREKVYKLFGFDRFIGLDNMEECVDPDRVKNIRNYVSDESSYMGIKNLFESKKKGEKLFVFNITMQNHGGYWESSDTTVYLQGMRGHYPETEQYLTLVQKSDVAFSNLIEYFSKVKEDTLVLMFGDHFPAIEQKFYEELKNKPLYQWSFEESLTRYIVPFVIWANYDIEEQKDVVTSVNYLQNYLLEVANIPKNGLNVFLDKQQEKIKAINAVGHHTENENWIPNEENPDLLSQYKKMGYYLLTE